jgi:hypothetical protein
MTSTTRNTIRPAQAERGVALIWHVWPIADNRRRSWLIVPILLALGLSIWLFTGAFLLAVAAPLGLAATLWQFFLPVEYEVAAHGLRRRVLGRTRLVPWHAIRAYQLRPSGVVLYQRGDPSRLDLLQSMFVLYPPEADELPLALRHYASHAAELP